MGLKTNKMLLMIKVREHNGLNMGLPLALGLHDILGCVGDLVNVNLLAWDLLAEGFQLTRVLELAISLAL